MSNARPSSSVAVLDAERCTARAADLLSAFASRTGLTSEQPARRYLWTDAFAVTALLELARRSGDAAARELAVRLVRDVHHTLGRHRADSGQSGWLSGLSEQEGALRPTAGGLRIGKPLPERRPDQPFDERLEWGRDGQYFHYLTKWMHALDQASRALAQPQLNLWARELAQVAHAAFRQPSPGGRAALAWKMSIDLARALVAASGQHDPLDGFITCAELRATARLHPGALGGPPLDRELLSLAAMLPSGGWSTADALSIGGLLFDAVRVAQLVLREQLPEDRLLFGLLAAALTGLQRYAALGDFRGPAARRLAFRELGLSLGLAGIELLHGWLGESRRAFARDASLLAVLRELRRYVELGAALNSFWLDENNRQAPTWLQHQDINEVMLASSLLPEAALVLRGIC